MSCILYPDDKEATDDRINIDDLYEKKQRQDLKQLSIYNKILNRVHAKIKLTAKRSVAEKCIWFLVPEFIFGQPLYDQGDCIGFVVQKLESNGFQCRYVHPNALYVSWAHWIPYYVRSEYQRKTGISIDEFGNVLRDKNAEQQQALLLNDSAAAAASTAATSTGKSGGGSENKFANAKGFKPQNILVYRDDLLQKMEHKFKEKK